MKILVINSGSSSLKYQLFDMRDEQMIAKGICERIGTKNSHFSHTVFNKCQVNEEVVIENHEKALMYMKDALITNKKISIIDSINEISAIGHRIVQGGKYFNNSVLINNNVIKKIESLIPLAPLHNKAHVNVITSCKKIFGENLKQVAVFDTAFHVSMPKKSYMYAIPYEYYQKHNIRKYGFHGISHKYVSTRCAQLMEKNFNELKMITCHIGNGSSITAINNGKVIDTSMGLTPLDGLMMGTRCGAIDPSIIGFLAEKERLSLDEVNYVLNKKSGLTGISGISNDYRDIKKEMEDGNEMAKLCHDMLVHQISKFIGGYLAILQKCNAIVFTAGIGENQWLLRKAVCDNLRFFGVKLDDTLNKNIVNGKEGKISSKDSLIDIYAIPTNEEIVIARDTKNILENFNKRD